MVRPPLRSSALRPQWQSDAGAAEVGHEVTADFTVTPSGQVTVPLSRSMAKRSLLNKPVWGKSLAGVHTRQAR